MAPGGLATLVSELWNSNQSINEKAETIGKNIGNFIGGLAFNAVIGGVAGGASKKLTEISGKTKSLEKLMDDVSLCHCFTAGTKVLTKDGEKSIEQVVVGDLVWSKNPDTGEMAYKEVDLLMQRPEDEIWKVYVGNEVISTSDKHPFWIKGKGWVVTKDLVPGDLFETSDGSHLSVNKIEVKHEPTIVYNFRVKDFHTYYVSNLKILTHNTSARRLCRLLIWGQSNRFPKRDQWP